MHDSWHQIVLVTSTDWDSEATLPSFEGLGQARKQLEGGGAGRDLSCDGGFIHAWKRCVGVMGT